MKQSPFFALVVLLFFTLKTHGMALENATFKRLILKPNILIARQAADIRTHFEHNIPQFMIEISNPQTGYTAYRPAVEADKPIVTAFLKEELAKILPLNPDSHALPEATDNGLFLAIFCVYPDFVKWFTRIHNCGGNRVAHHADLHNARGQTPLEYAQQRALDFGDDNNFCNSEELKRDSGAIIQLLKL